MEITNCGAAMNADAKMVAVEMTKASDESRVNFGEVVMTLMKAGIERYHADLMRAEKTYYLPNGESETVPCHPLGGAFAQEFTATDVERAVRAAQTGQITYAEFCRLIADAGCVGYHVSIVGKRVVYYGRTGDFHIEWFPGAKRNAA